MEEAIKEEGGGRKEQGAVARVEVTKVIVETKAQLSNLSSNICLAFVM